VRVPHHREVGRHALQRQRGVGGLRD
jgi:hypothetical protein